MEEEKVEVTIDITESEYKKLNEKLELFNNNVPPESKLNFDEFISLVFETTLLKEKLDSKYEYLDTLKTEVKQLEEKLTAKYSIGLTNSKEISNEVIESRKQILKDASAHIDGLY